MMADTGKRLDGKVAVVFGAGSRGAELSNGRAAALTFAREGAAVVSVDRDPEQAELTARTITDAGGRAVSVPADVTEEKDVVAVLEATTAEFGPPTVLHNNVGASATGSLLELDVVTWEAQFRLNVTGAFLTTKHAVPAMIDVGGGAIVNVSAVSSQRHPGSDQVVAYTTAKAALNHLTQSTALSYAAQGVRANALLLGLIDTPIAAGEDPTQSAGLREARDRRSPTGRSGSPWDVAHAAAFLASDEAGYINGVCLPVDGGLHFSA